MLRLRVAELSHTKGWTMRTVAEILGVDHQTVMYWNQGRSYPRLPTLIRLSQLLNTTIEDLITLH